MTRISWLSAISCTALLVGLAASGCGGTSSTIDNGMGGEGPGAGGGRAGIGGTLGTGGRVTGTGGTVVTGTGGMMGTDAGTTTCAPNAMCTAGFTCNRTCPAGDTTACTCSAAGRVNCAACPVADAGTPPADAGMNMCAANAMCTAGFTCDETCNVAGGGTGTRACTCSAAGRVNCPGACMGAATDAGRPADAGTTACMANAMCAAGFTCEETCMAGGGAMGTRACTCSAAGRVNCPGACMTAGADAGPPPADAGTTACMANAMCAAGFTCEETCMVGGGGMGTRACTCSAAGRVNCPGACMAAAADAGAMPTCAATVMNMTACTMGDATCNTACGGNMRNDRCTCNAGFGADAGSMWRCVMNAAMCM